jgi:hypothetical protein
MKTNPLHEGAFMIHGKGIGPMNRAMIQKRACELAVINGRQPHEATKSDWDEAMRELSGGTETVSKEEFLESVPESERWDPIPGSPGHEALVDFNDDEDEEGRGVTERLFEEGVEEAGHDQMLEAAERPPLDQD